MTKTAFAERLKALRRIAELSQAKLAKKAGVSLRCVTDLEQCRRQPTWETVKALCDALGCSCEQFRDTKRKGK